MERNYILVVEDHTRTRQGLKNYLQSTCPELEIDEARNGREAVDQVTEQPPNLIIMDMVMPRLDGARATREIKAHWPEVKVVLLLLDPEQGQLALESGADAYLLKEGDSRELLEIMSEMGISDLETDDPKIESSSDPEGETVKNNHKEKDNE